MAKIFTAAEMAEIDQLAVSQHGISRYALMENAGRGLAALASEIIPKGRVAVLCGKGSNGGDGLAAARFLKESGTPVEVLLVCKPEALKPDAKEHYEKLRSMGITVHILPPDEAPEACRPVFDECTGIVDALFGLGLNRPLTSPWRDIVDAINETGKKVVSADLPSGLNADTGDVMGACVKAAATAVFGGLKKGLTEGSGPQKSGQIRVIDIGIPPELLI